MNVQGKPVCAFDPEGLVFSVGVQSEQVKLYDLRSFDRGPFITFKLPQEKQCEWTGLKFRFLALQKSLIVESAITFLVRNKLDGQN